MPVDPHKAASPTATSLLTVDLGALRANYRTLRDHAGKSECASVIKADAYGTGAEQAVRALFQDACRTYFVATFGEAEIIRSTAPDTTIYVLDGFFEGSGPAFAGKAIRPVLSSLAEAQDWAAFCRDHGTALPAALHIDTGMNRLGMPRSEVEQLAREPELLASFAPALLISHLACADEQDNPLNQAQLKAFEELRAMLPPCPASLANSAGIFLGPRYHFDLVRPGFALYGGKAIAGREPLRKVVRLDARIVQIHDAQAGESVGYGAAQTLARPTRIATIAIGYADGIFRCLGAGDGRNGFTGYIDGHEAPALGRVSMDLITLDVTDVPDGIARRGTWVEIIGEHVSVDDLAERAGTIGYEILTSLSRRAQHIYIGSEAK
ncbi:MAG: alanine racemase [Methyloligellaceae bacterium]